MFSRSTALFFFGAGFASLAVGEAQRVTDVHVPILDCRVEVPGGFKATDPRIVVVYSNTSPYNAIWISAPREDYEQKILVPQVFFDGRHASYADPKLEEQELLPESGVFVEPCQEVRVEYRIADRFVVPGTWTEITVFPTHQLLAVVNSYTFDHGGREVRVSECQPKSINDIRDRILQVPRIRKALLEDTLRVPRPGAGGDSAGATTPVTPTATSTGPVEAAALQPGRAEDASTHKAVKNDAGPPVRTPRGGLPWGIMAAGAVVAAALLGVLVRTAVRRNTRPGKTNE